MQQSSIKRVCLISNYNLYESKRHFTLKLAEAMQRKGIETLHIDVKESALNAETLGAIARFNPNFTCSFNTLLPIGQGNFLCDYLQIPHWSILLDPVAYSMDLIKSPYSIISYVDQQDSEWLKKESFENHLFFPHAVEKELIGSSHEKIYDVVFIGSCDDYERIESLWMKEQPKEIQKIIVSAAEKHLLDAETSIASSLYAAWKESNLPEEKFDLLSLFYYVDYFNRGKDRVELIRSIRDVKIHVFGAPMEDGITEHRGWDYYLKDKKNVCLHPPISFPESLEILKQSKIVLSSAPFFKNGSHERIFTALACGALPLANETLYWKEQFVEGEEIIFHRPWKRDETNRLIHDMLNDEAKRQQMVAKGAQKVKALHTWDQRVDSILQTLPSLLLEF